MNRLTRLVLPTPCDPRMTSFASIEVGGRGPGVCTGMALGFVEEVADNGVVNAGNGLSDGGMTAGLQ